jgi:hypothetical protein
MSIDQQQSSGPANDQLASNQSPPSGNHSIQDVNTTSLEQGTATIPSVEVSTSALIVTIHSRIAALSHQWNTLLINAQGARLSANDAKLAKNLAVRTVREGQVDNRSGQIAVRTEGVVFDTHFSVETKRLE